MSCDKISQALPPLFFGAGQRSYMELLRGRRESLGTRLLNHTIFSHTILMSSHLNINKDVTKDVGNAM